MMPFSGAVNWMTPVPSPTFFADGGTRYSLRICSGCPCQTSCEQPATRQAEKIAKVKRTTADERVRRFMFGLSECEPWERACMANLVGRTRGVQIGDARPSGVNR